MTVARFWREQNARYNLIGTYCESCKAHLFPPRDICPKCYNAKLTNKELSGQGEIISFTEMHVAQEGFDLQTPYMLGIIQLKEGPRVTAQIVDSNFTDVKIGAKVQSTFRRISEDGKTGAIYYGYKFKLLK